jgi:protein pelota
MWKALLAWHALQINYNETKFNDGGVQVNIRESPEKTKIITVEEDDDLWYLSNILSPSDEIRMTVMRRVERKQDMNRSKETERKPARLTIRIESTGFQEFSKNLRVLGVVVEGPEDIIGDHQSFSISQGETLEIVRKEWSDREKQFLEESSGGSGGGTIFVTLDDETAEVFLSRSYGNQRIARIESGKSGKMYEGNYSEDVYFSKIYDVLKNYSGRGAGIVISGEGFVPAKFGGYLASYRSQFAWIECFQTTRSDEGSIFELLSGDGGSRALEKLRLSKDAKYVENFKMHLKKDNLATYGIEQVSKATSLGAVDILLITDTEFRKDSIRDILKIAEGYKTRIHILSSSAEPGKLIQSFGGICAVLRYPIDG